MGQPIPDSLVARLDFARSVCSAFPDQSSWYVDMDKFRETINSGLIQLARSGIYPDKTSFLNGGNLFGEALSDSGLFGLVHNSAFPGGPLLGKYEFNGVPVNLAALTDGPMVIGLYDAGSSLILVDAAAILDTAVCRLNFIRYHEPEYLSVLLGKTSSASSKELIGKRLSSLVDTATIDESQAYLILEQLVGQKLETESAFIIGLYRAITLRTIALFVNSIHDSDELVHTLNLCNAIARSTVILQSAIQSEFSRMVRANHISPNGLGDYFTRHYNWLVLVGWFADMAYGDPLYRMASICELILSDADNGTAAHFRQYGLPHIGRGITRAYPEDQAVTSFLQIDANRLREVAKNVLDDILEHAGLPPFGVLHPDIESVFRKIQNTTFINQDTLPTIVWVMCGREYS